MKKAQFMKLFMVIVSIIAAVALTGCNPRGDVDDDLVAPTVVSVVPAAEATEIAINTSISVTFSEAMNVDTIVAENFTVMNGLVSTLGEVSYDAASKTATFDPTGNLDPDSEYDLTITTGVEDVSGNALAEDFTWSFMTSSAEDLTAPTVISTSPARDGEIGIGENIVVTFSEPMLPASLLATGTFTVVDAEDVVALGEVSIPTTTTARFTPSPNLGSGKEYTATITIAATDAAGNHLIAEYSWSFTTATEVVDVIAPTVVSTLPLDDATLVALNSNITATFSEAMDEDTILAANFIVMNGSASIAGAVSYDAASKTATFNPTSGLPASLPIDVTITTGMEDVAGNALALPYTWSFTTGTALDSTAPTVDSTVPANAGVMYVNDYIDVTFSEAMLGSSILAAGTFTVRNEAEQLVAGTVSNLNSTTARFTPAANLAYGSSYTATITVAAKDVAGNALATAKVWSFDTHPAPDITRPLVSSTLPADGGSIAITGYVEVTFNEPMQNASLLAEGTFTVKDALDADVAGVVTSLTETTARFTPDTVLAYSSTYTATISVAAVDTAGNALAVPKIWSFTTVDLPDETSPTVVSTSPEHNAATVAINSNIDATFSEQMLGSSLTASGTFTLAHPDSGSVAGVVTTPTGTTARFNPTANLEYSTIYTATISTVASDTAGNTLEIAKVWSFTTGEEPDLTEPTVTATSPVDGGIIQVNGYVVITFSEPMLADSILAPGTFTVRDAASNLVAGTVSNPTSSTARFTPTAELPDDTVFTATLTTAATDLSGNHLAVAEVWSFKTPDETAPTVVSTIPVDADFLNVDEVVSVTFSEDMLEASLLEVGTFTLKDSASANVVGVVDTPTPTTAVFTPSADLIPDEEYTATISVFAKDLEGNALVIAEEWTFTTRPFNPIAPTLGETERFALISSQGISNDGASTKIIGAHMMIMDQADSYFTGFTPGLALSGIYEELDEGKYAFANNTADGIQPAPHASVTAFITQTRNDLTAADNFLAAVNLGAPSQECPSELGGLTLTRGVYTTSVNVTITQGTGVTLDAQGDADSVWIFVIAGTLDTVSQANGNVILTNGALPENVYWRTSDDTTFAADTIFQGKVFAAKLIAVGTNAVVNGSLFSLTSEVTLLANNVTKY